MVASGHSKQGPFVVESVLDGKRYQLRAGDGMLERMYDERDMELALAPVKAPQTSPNHTQDKVKDPQSVDKSS